MPIHDMHQPDNVKWGWFIGKTRAINPDGMKTFQEDTLMVSHVWSLLHMCMSICTRRVWQQEGFILRGSKPPRGGCCWWCCPRPCAAPLDPTEGEKIAPLSCSHLTVLGSYNLKNSNFYFFFKGKSWYSSTKNRALIIIYSKTINPIILYLFFPLKCFVLVKYI